MATASLYARNKFHAYGVRFLYFELGFNLGCGSVMFATKVASTRISGTKKPTIVGLCHFQ